MNIYQKICQALVFGFSMSRIGGNEWMVFGLEPWHWCFLIPTDASHRGEGRRGERSGQSCKILGKKKVEIIATPSCVPCIPSVFTSWLLMKQPEEPNSWAARGLTDEVACIFFQKDLDYRCIICIMVYIYIDWNEFEWDWYFLFWHEVDFNWQNRMT